MWDWLAFIGGLLIIVLLKKRMDSSDTNIDGSITPRGRAIQHGDNPSVRILALGASLIEGFVRTGRTNSNPGTYSFAPFTNKLVNIIRDDFPKLQFLVDNQGKAGQRTDEVLARAKIHLAKNSFTHVVLLVGTNDVMQLPINLANSIANVKQIYDMIISSGAKCFVLTLPIHEIETLPGNDILLTRRLKYNEELKKIIPAKDIVLFDQWKYTALPRIKDMFCDEIHFTPKGYDIFAEYIYDNIKSSIQSYAHSSNL